MQTSLFSFDLPPDLIASEPPPERGLSRLMVLERNGDASPRHRMMADLPALLEPGTLMVFNDTRVRKARMFAENAETGARSEFLFLESALNPETGAAEWDCVVEKAKKKRAGQTWLFPGGVRGVITGVPASDRRTVALSDNPDESWFEEYGHIPLPPYIRRPDTPRDEERYQTVYARDTGSAAAPTAGLHFTPEILRQLTVKGIEIAWVTLQVGLGTFAPVRTDQVEDHSMHTERYHVPAGTSVKVRAARESGRNVLAVGTTSLRTLEASWNGREPEAGWGSTNLFIYPGYRFKAVDQLFTNFHTPHSSLLMLVSAFCGRERLLKAYGDAVQDRYRFFSYGDAMLIR
jgi:S-adenosylmethionine:tRNA ribosyltransferase-isomerase